MEISNVTANVATTYATADQKAEPKVKNEKNEKAPKENSKFSDVAATYEKSDSDAVTKKNNPSDRTALIKQLKADQERMKQNLFDIVRKSIAGQGNAFALANPDDMWKILASGEFTADPAAIAQAKEDISEDGYWGVDKTSSRIVDFAIALSGNDTSKAELLINAFKKGFEQATGLWGKDLPDISNKTYDAVMEKFDAWKNGTYESATE